MKAFNQFDKVFVNLEKKKYFEYFYGTEGKAINITKDFLSSTNQKEMAIKYIKDSFHLFPKINKDEDFHFLDMGCGGCYLTQFVLKELSHNYSFIHACLMDPSTTLLQVCKNNHYLNNNHKCQIIFKTNGLIENNNLASAVNSQKFDFILCSHIFFWIENWPFALAELLNVLKPNGLLCIIILSRETEPDIFDFRNQLFKIAHQSECLELETAEKLESIAKDCRYAKIKKSIPFISEVIIPWLHNKQELLIPTNQFKNISQKTINTLEFLLRKPWDNIDFHSKEKLIGLLIQKANNNQVHIKIPEKMIWITKD